MAEVKRLDNKQRLFLISLDAVGSKDMEYMSSLPNFGRFLKDAAYCPNVKSVYPTLTYPAHTSIITGRYPIHHGVVNNTMFQPKRLKPDWFYRRKNIVGTTLYDEVIKKGWKAASLLWPVTGKSRIHYNLPEIHPYRWWQTQITTTLFQGSAGYILGLLPYLTMINKGTRQPALDDFVHKSALHTIRKYNPNLVMVHYLDVDFTRHGYGLNNNHVKEAMQRMDKRLGELFKVIEETGDLTNTTICVFGDHYQKDTHTIFYPNTFLKEQGYIKVRGKSIASYKAVVKNCDGAAYIYLNPEYETSALKEELEKKVLMLFEKASQNAAYGIKHIVSREEAIQKGADANCIGMLEAADGFYFLDETEVLLRNVSEEKLHKMRATHGYDPMTEDYGTFFMAKGKNIKENVLIDSMELVDEGTTLAHMLGIDLGEVDGKVIYDMLKK